MPSLLQRLIGEGDGRTGKRRRIKYSDRSTGAGFTAALGALICLSSTLVLSNGCFGLLFARLRRMKIPRFVFVLILSKYKQRGRLRVCCRSNQLEVPYSLNSEP